MHKLPLLFVAVLAALLPAQENMREVGKGREVRDSKLLTPGQSDTWAIEAKADEVLRCRVTSQHLDPVLELVDAAGNVLRSDDGKGSQSYIEYRIAEASKVSFRVSGYRGGGGGRYEFWLERYVAPSVALGEEVVGKFGPEQWAHVRLELQKGERVVAMVTGGTLRQVTLLGDRPQKLLPHMHTYTATESGEYHLRMEGAHGHDYRLLTQRPVNRSVAINEAVEVQLSPWAVDIVRIEVPASVAVMFDLGMPVALLQQWPQLLGKNPKWQLLNRSLLGGRSRDLYWSQDGVAVDLWLHNASAKPASYSFVPRLADVDLSTSTHRGCLPLGDLLCHTIEAQAGDVVSLITSSSSFDPCIKVFDPNGRSPDGWAEDRGLLDRTASSTFHAKFSGTYRVLVATPGLVGSGDYDMQVTRHEVPVLKLGQTLQLPCDPKSDAYAHLQLKKGQEVWLSSRSAAVDCAISLVDERGKHYGTWEGGGIGGDVLQAFRAEHACTLTVFVHARSGKGTCRLRAVAVE